MRTFTGTIKELHERAKRANEFTIVNLENASVKFEGKKEWLTFLSPMPSIVSHHEEIVLHCVEQENTDKHHLVICPSFEYVYTRVIFILHNAD